VYVLRVETKKKGRRWTRFDKYRDEVAQVLQMENNNATSQMIEGN
jgi:hypothetical protein